MTHPGRRERRGQIAVHQVPETDQDAGGETGLGFGKHPRERLGRAAPQLLEAAAGIVGRRPDLERPRREGPRRADPKEIRAVGRIRSRPDRPGYYDTVARVTIG